MTTTTTTRFTIPKSSLAPILAVAAQVAVRDQNQPNAGLVRLLVCSGLLVEIEVFDGIIGVLGRELVSTGADEVEIVNDTIVVDAKALYSRVHDGLADGDIVIEHAKTATTGRVSLTTRGFQRRFDIPSSSADTFIAPPPIERLVSVEIAAPVLRDVLRSVEYAACKDPHVTQSVLLSPLPGQLQATALDGRRLARSTVSVNGMGFSPPVLVPARIARMLDKVMRDDSTVVVATNGQHVWFLTDGFTFSAPRTDPVAFPMVDVALDNARRQCTHRVVVSRKGLVSELSAAAIVNDQVHLSVEGGSLSITGTEADRGDVFCTVSAEVRHIDGASGVFPKASVNARYLLDALGASRESETVSIDVDDEATLFRVEAAEGTVAIIAAMR